VRRRWLPAEQELGRVVGAERAQAGQCKCTPCYTTLRGRRKLQTIYTVDTRGIANDLVTYTDTNWPFLTLATRSDAQPLMHDSNQEKPREVTLARVSTAAWTANGCQDGERCLNWRRPWLLVLQVTRHLSTK
jgi:hypothetical protein